MTSRDRGKERARRAARGLLRRHGAEVPVDVEAIARAEGVDVRTEELEDVVSGFLVVRGGRSVIGVNAAHHPHRRRFTVAHELAHRVLHPNRATLFLDGAPLFFRTDGAAPVDGLMEREANAFAAELLMPAAAVEVVMREEPFDVHDEAATRRMAGRFGVSAQALVIRLAELDLLVP